MFSELIKVRRTNNMYLMYADESGNTGTDLDNKSQPVLSLAGIVIEDNKWHKVNDFFEAEKIKIYPEFKSYEIHASELFNPPKSSIFNKYPWEDNLRALEKIVDLILACNIKLYYTSIYKPAFKKHLLHTFGDNIKIDPYLYAFSLNYNHFNEDMEKLNSYGIVFSDDLQNITQSIELLYPKLVCNNKNIIEKSFYLDSKKNNFIQIADICALYINKFICIRENYCRYNAIKEKHCVLMYEKIMTLCENYIEKNISFEEQLTLDNLFK